jgi:hypothetical protein
MKSVNEWCEQIRARMDFNDNERGNTIFRTHADTDRYIVDFADKFKAEGWEQYDTDQDAHYFGVWVNPRSRMVLTYAEGDWSVVTCPTKESYLAEIQSMNEFYGQGFICKVLDQSGVMTTYCQDRAEFLKVD